MEFIFAKAIVWKTLKQVFARLTLFTQGLSMSNLFVNIKPKAILLKIGNMLTDQLLLGSF